ncbi:ATP-binding protein [Nonomuraea sp. NPDC047897]|uniref:HAMP domain-containing sensor histidine kinase n=1 Tax=Nonomuraea sp. NPDC047897 TaxID=3364346 RepID=UPI00371DA5C4
MRRGSLRSRLTLLVALAVALAVAISSGACYMIVRQQLYDQMGRALRPDPGASPYQRKKDLDYVGSHCTTDASVAADFQPPEINQLVFSDGRPTCHLGPPIVVRGGDRRIAARGGFHTYTGATTDGTAVLVFVEGVEPGMARMKARRLDQLHDTLNMVALLLGAVAALGVLGAALAGWAVSRTALAPVGRLTRAVEHIAQTEDLTTRIPIAGTDEIARLGSSFNAMTAALAGSRERQQQLVADAGHELRTPLTTLRTNIDLLLRSEQTGRSLDPGAKERLLVNVKAQFAELSTLVGDLLQLARGDTDHEPHVELALHDVVEAAVERARLRGAEVTTDLDPWHVVGGAASLERAVLNLIDNAAKFGPGQVDVALRGGELTVRDRGPGIPEGELPHVFNRFWRSPTARGMPGSGLGLAIVAQAVAEAGGQARLANAPGGGILATITLPGKSHPALRNQ